MIEETKYDDSIECHHSYDERCHTTYTTDYEPQQVSFVCEIISVLPPPRHAHSITFESNLTTYYR